MIGRVNVGGGSGTWSDAIIRVLAPVGSTVTATNGTITYTGIEHDVSSVGEYFFYIHQANYGTWTLTATLSGQTTTETVVVNNNIEYNVTMSYFHATLKAYSTLGATVTATKGSYSISGTVVNPHGLPSAYQEVEYLQSDGNSWIDTGVVQYTNEGYELDANVTYANRQSKILGSYALNNYGIGIFSLIYENTPFINAVINGIDSNYTYGSSLSGTRHIYKQVNGSVYLDGEQKYSLTALTTQCPSNTLIFNGNSDRVSSVYPPAIMVLYSAKLLDSTGNTTHHYIPCYRKSDNVAGLYDIIEDEFLTNAGTGTFTVGADVCYATLDIIDSGTWSVTDNQSYANPQSVSVTTAGDIYTCTITHRLYLYKAGDECTSVSGGWAAAAISSVGWPLTAPTVTKGSSSMTCVLSGSSRSGSVLTANAIDLTDFSNLCIDLENTSTYTVSGQYHYAKVVADTTLTSTPSVAAAIIYIDVNGTASYDGTVTVDVSALTSFCYVGIDISAQNSTDSNIIRNVYLEV